jgi:DNA-binding transcriptional MerR regulator
VAKGPDAFRTISEAAEEVGAPPHVLRFWETKFTFIKPMKRAGGRRFYRPADIAALKGVRRLLHEQGYTIKGVQKLVKAKGVAALGPDAAELDAAPEPPVEQTPPAPGVASAAPDTARLRDLLIELEAAKAALDRALAAA